MKHLIIPAILACLASSTYATEFGQQLSVHANDLKVVASKNSTAIIPGRAVLKDLYVSNDPWWRGSDAERVRQKFDELTDAEYQLSISHGPISSLAARKRVCDALKTISWEGTVDPANIDRVIDWMDHNVDGLYGQLSQIRARVGVWASMTLWSPCISKHSRYLSDRIHGVTGK